MNTLLDALIILCQAVGAEQRVKVKIWERNKSKETKEKRRFMGTSGQTTSSKPGAEPFCKFSLGLEARGKRLIQFIQVQFQQFRGFTQNAARICTEEIKGLFSIGRAVQIK